MRWEATAEYFLSRLPVLPPVLPGTGWNPSALLLLVQANVLGNLGFQHSHPFSAIITMLL